MTNNNNNNKPVTVQDFTFKHYYGFCMTPEEASTDKTHFLDVERRFTRSLCFAIGSGGVYTDRQARWIKGYIMTKGTPQEVVDSVDGMLQEASELLDVELVGNASGLNDLHLLKQAGPVMIYEMYRCASLEDYPEEQMLAISLIAEELGVTSGGALDNIKKQVDLENEVMLKRIQLLFQKGNPLLDEKYLDSSAEA